MSSHADPGLFGGLPARVGHGTVHGPGTRTGHEVDVYVRGKKLSAPAERLEETLTLDEQTARTLRNPDRVLAKVTAAQPPDQPPRRPWGYASRKR